MAVLRAVLGWLAGGSALATLVSVVLAVCALVLCLIYRRYLGILAADRRKPAERRAYEVLRESLIEGNLAARLYADRLTRFLNWVDRVFGDAEKSDRTLFAHAFGLRTPAPLWTATAFDRCLFLALFYPILTIILIWAVSGRVGPAENALQLRPEQSGWVRAAVVIGVSSILFALKFGPKPEEDKSFLRVILFVSILFFGFGTLMRLSYLAGFMATLLIISISGLNGAARGAEAILWVITYTVWIGLLDHPSVAGRFDVQSHTAFLVNGSIFVSVLLIARKAAVRWWRGIFLSLFVPAMIATCLADVTLLSYVNGWADIGPPLLFLGLLTLLNAPFDWASLGLTRALLRRGLELGGWWPYFLALVDAALAAVVIAVLALTMVIGVQAFDVLAVHWGGKPILPLEPLFTGIAANPSAPEYWWIYALLLSTMIPSLINLVIGGTSLVRGLPGVPFWVLQYIPKRGGVLKWDRHWIATFLTAQIAAGAVLGIAAQVSLVVAIIGYVMPFFGLEFLDMARDVAAFNLPARVGQLFEVSL
jgi:hypothetical protein